MGICSEQFASLHFAAVPHELYMNESQCPACGSALLCPSLLQQKDDLARMYRLFQRIPKGLDPVAELFRKHVESEGMQRVKEATETAAAKKEKDAGAGQEIGFRARRLAACVEVFAKYSWSLSGPKALLVCRTQSQRLPRTRSTPVPVPCPTLAEHRVIRICLLLQTTMQCKLASHAAGLAHAVDTESCVRVQIRAKTSGWRTFGP